MAYTKTEWVNDSVPAINASNLNKIEQGIYDNSFESGSNANGSYMKFSDGTLICTNTVSFSNINTDYTWGGLYTNVNYPVVIPNYPVSFIDVPNITFSLRKCSGSLLLLSDPSYASTKISPGRVQICRPTTATGLSGEISFIAIGRWK